MDYREFQEKYGNKVNKALSDKEYIDWLLKVFKEEGFGTAKQVAIIDGYKTQAVKINETDTDITYRVDAFEARTPQITSVVAGGPFEWGQSLLAANISVDIVVTRTSYPLFSLAFTGVDELDKDKDDINAAGVNDNLFVDFPWAFDDVFANNDLNGADTIVGTVTAVDDKGQTVNHNITAPKASRWIWGLTDGVESAADIAFELGLIDGSIVPEDEHSFFYSVITDTTIFPPEILVDTFGSLRTLFVIEIAEPSFILESTIPFEIPSTNHTIDLNNISGGVANASRDYPVQTIDLNTLVKLIKI